MVVYFSRSKVLTKNSGIIEYIDQKHFHASFKHIFSLLKNDFFHRFFLQLAAVVTNFKVSFFSDNRKSCFI